MVHFLRILNGGDQQNHMETSIMGYDTVHIATISKR